MVIHIYILNALQVSETYSIQPSSAQVLTDVLAEDYLSRVNISDIDVVPKSASYKTLYSNRYSVSESQEGGF